MLIYLYQVEVAPYWNINLISVLLYNQISPVEVAPYWNVNLAEIHWSTYITYVEVAPYWNVNGVDYKFQLGLCLGRSSTILECKLLHLLLYLL